jgi:hypothetical protein
VQLKRAIEKTRLLRGRLAVAEGAIESLRLRGRNRPGEQQAGSQKSQSSVHMGVHSHYSSVQVAPAEPDLSVGEVAVFGKGRANLIQGGILFSGFVRR